jgi:iron complex transport system ATP-binding protein
VSPEPKLQTHALAVHYGNRVALRPLDFAAPAGTLTAVVGPNGAGKTTLLRALAGLIPSRGSVTLDGHALGVLSPRQRALRLAYVPQRSALDARLSVEDVALSARYAHHRAWFAPNREDRRAALQALERTRTLPLRARPFPELSGGEQRRVLLARALATGAQTLLLDEPTSFLDVRHALQVFEILAELRSAGYCLIATLHDLDDVVRHATFVTILDTGRCVAHGPPAAALSAETVRQVYGVDLVPHHRIGFRLLGNPAT